jgi:hypothetical protein
MVRGLSSKTKSVGRPSNGRATAAKIGAAKHRAAPKLPVAAAASASKEELRARVEKLERANATLRIKNKELRIVAVEAAEQVDALTVQLANSERRAGRQARQEATAETLDSREIAGTGRGKRKVRAGAEDHDRANQDMGADAHASWGSHGHVEA